MSSPENSTKKRGILLALIGITVAPVLASYLTYYFWKPAGGLTYGQLLDVHPVAAFKQTTLEGKPASLADFKGKWLLVMVDSGACNPACGDALHALRQFRVAQGKDMGRVERLWLLSDSANPAPEAIAKAEGATIHRAQEAIPLPGDLASAYYLIDPLGNQVIRYPRSADPVKVIKEIGKFLKNNENLG